MKTPNERLKRLKKVHTQIATQQYGAAIRLSGKILELGLKDCTQIISNSDPNFWKKTIESFNEGRSRPLNVDQMGLGTLVRLFFQCNLWEKLRIIIDSNLFYAQMIPWRKLVNWRNKATHHEHDFSRQQALEIFHYSKVFLYDCDLIPGGRNRIPDVPNLPMQKCHNCSEDVSPDWNFCPACGHRTVQTCSNCNRTLSPEWNICPYCNTNRNMVENALESRAMYKLYCEGIWADLIVTVHEREFLEEKRLQLGIDPETASNIEEEVIPNEYIRFKELLEAVFLDHELDEYEFEFLMDKAENLGIKTSLAAQIIDTYKVSISELESKK